MPKIIVNDRKGLFQKSGGGIHIGTDIAQQKFNLGAPLVSALQTSDGTAADGSTGVVNTWSFQNGSYLYAHAIGTQTITVPQVATTGLNVAGDETDNDGWEICGRSNTVLGTLNKDYFTVGTSPAFYLKVKFSIADVSGTDDLRCGFRKVEAHQADPDDFDELAALQVSAGDVKSTTIINNAATVTTDLSVDDWADGESHTFEVRVSDLGAVTYRYDGAAPSGAVAYSFDTGEVVTPFWFHRHDADIAGDIIWESFEYGLQDASVVALT